MELLLFLFLMASQSGRGGGSDADRARREAEEARRRAQQATHDEQAHHQAQQQPPAWPVAAPTGLPAFPSGWMYYPEPIPPAIHTRAWQLLDSLWARGAGTTQLDKTGAEWITYRAEITQGNKRGVVAYRPKLGAPPAPAALPTLSQRSPGAALPTPAPATAAHSPTSVTAPAPAPALSPAHAAAVHPLLHQGSGMGILTAQAPAVRDLQLRLHVMPADGKFGTNTRESVMTFQRSHGLKPDGVVGPLTWAALDHASNVPVSGPEPLPLLLV